MCVIHTVYKPAGPRIHMNHDAGAEPEPDPARTRDAAYTVFACYFDTKMKDGNAGYGWQKEIEREREGEEWL